MQCQEFDVCLADFIEGGLDPAKTLAMREHAAACRQCESLLAEYSVLVQDLRAIPAMECPQPVIEGIMATLGEDLQRSEKNAGVNRRGNFRRYAVLGAAAILAAGIIYFSTRTDFGNRREEFTEEEVFAARKQVELTLGYLYHYGALTENILKEEVLTRGIQKPIEASIKKTIGQF